MILGRLIAVSYKMVRLLLRVVNDKSTSRGMCYKVRTRCILFDMSCVVSVGTAAAVPEVHIVSTATILAPRCGHLRARSSWQPVLALKPPPTLPKRHCRRGRWGDEKWRGIWNWKMNRERSWQSSWWRRAGWTRYQWLPVSVASTTQ